MDSLYGVAYPVMSFAVSNELSKTLNQVCYKLGSQLQPFCFFADENQRNAGIIDFANFNGIAGQDTLLNEIALYRSKVLSAEGINVNPKDEERKKFLLYDYLLSTSVCYVEVPKYQTKEGFAMATFDKFLCTRNPNIMAAWMGMSAHEMQVKYSNRIRYNPLDITDNVIRLVKLSYSNNGNKISVPRGTFDVAKISCCMPLFMLNAFVIGLKPHLESKYLRFTFKKDNGTLRVLDTTLDFNKLMSVYNDNGYVSNMLSGTDIQSMKLGSISVSSKISRGYVKVPEVGASKYDTTGTRSLNLARLIKVEEITEPDTRFINVDLNSVVSNFKLAIDYAVQHFPDELPSIYKAVTGEEAVGMGVSTIVEKLYSDADSKAMFLSTTYFRNLHLFMVSNPLWFPLYSGKPAETFVSSKNFGVDTMEGW